MRKSRQESQVHIREGLKQSKNQDFYEGAGHLLGDYKLEVNQDKLTKREVFGLLKIVSSLKYTKVDS